MQLLPLFLSLLSSSSITLANQCYFANGTQLQDRDGWAAHQPCGFDPVRTICCATNRANKFGGDFEDGGDTQDKCLPNGVCQNEVWYQEQNITTFWVNFCTNSDVTSNDCLDICRGTRNEGGGTQVTPCDGSAASKKWCCGTTKECCTNDYEVIRLPQRFQGRPVTTTSGLATAIATGSASPASSTVSNPTKTSTQHDSSLSAGAKAGIGVGAAVGMTAILGAIFFAYKARSWKKKATNPSPYPIEGTGYAEVPWLEKYRHAGYPPLELPDGRTAPMELASASPTELPGSGPGFASLAPK